MRSLFLLLFVLAPVLVIAQDAPTLASLEGRNRVLLIFAPSDRTPDFQRQLDLLSKHVSKMRERDLVLLPVVTTANQPTGVNTLRMAHPPVASQTKQLNLRHRFHVAPEEFTVILIGKDGGEKLRQHTPIPIEKLNATIDAMPMRRDEMRSRNNPEGGEN